MVFDPFHDYAERGYLQNHFRLPDGRAIATLILASWVKHLSINRQLLASCDAIGYEEVLRVHRNFMAPIFPWGGMDRLAVMPDRAVRKGNIRFALPFEIRPMMEDVLYKAQRADYLRTNPGFVMGVMAQAHPFLDGNGRTFLIIHEALCHRAGFSIDWMSVNPTAYLSALSSELQQPGEGLLDQFLDPFIQDVPDSPTLAVEPDTLKARWNAQARRHAVCGAVVDRSAQGVVQQSDDGAYVHWPFSVLNHSKLSVGDRVQIYPSGLIRFLYTD